MSADGGPGETRAAGGTERRAILEVADLHKEYGGNRVVDGLSFTVARGRMTGLIGPNGAGKSTAVGIIAGAISPTGGRVHLEGEDVTGQRAHALARRGLIRTFQLTTTFARLTVLENLLVAAPDQQGATFTGALRGRRRWRGREAELIEQAFALLEEFGLTQAANQYAGELSGGQGRLVEIARALMARPTLLLLDEPLAGVNQTLRHSIEEHLMRLRDQGVSMILVEHELATVDRCCDVVVVMARGRVLAEGSMRTLRENPEVVDAYLGG